MRKTMRRELSADLADGFVMHPKRDQSSLDSQFQSRALYERVQLGLEALDINMEEHDIRRCIDHLALVERWNRTMNLTSVSGAYDYVSHHLMDSLSVMAAVKGGRIIDLGSGAGFPGIPLALACPIFEVTLVDSNRKKAEFLMHVAARLKLTNVEVLYERAQNIEPDELYDVAVARALGSIEAVRQLASPLLKDGGLTVVMKGRYPDKELSDLSNQADATVHQLNVPGLQAQRHLVVIGPTGRSEA